MEVTTSKTVTLKMTEEEAGSFLSFVEEVRSSEVPDWVTKKATKYSEIMSVALGKGK